MTTAPRTENTFIDSQVVSPEERIQIESIICDLAQPDTEPGTEMAQHNDAIVEAMQAHISDETHNNVGRQRHAELPRDCQLTKGTKTSEAQNIPGQQLVVRAQENSDSGDSEDSQDGKNISRHELVDILENFVRLVKQGDPINGPEVSFAPGGNGRGEGFSIKDKTEETVELRCMLVQAQETIIRLLTDRVEDKAKIATLESQMRLLPDLQSQADRALQVAMHTDDFKTELKSVKLEIERIKLAKVRTEMDSKTRPWWSRFSEWMLAHDSSIEKID